MKRLLGILAVAVFAAWTCQATDYSLHMHPARVFRVALGSGTAPSAADMLTYGIQPGDEVVNTDDNALYIMNATNKYVKVSAAGAITTASTINGATINTTMITNVIAEGQVLPAVDASAATNISPAGIIMAPGKVMIGWTNNISKAQTISGVITVNTQGITVCAGDLLNSTNALNAAQGALNSATNRINNVLFVNGKTIAITNTSTICTNVLYYTNGLLGGVTLNP